MEGPLDLSLVEGSVTTAADERHSQHPPCLAPLVTIGAHVPVDFELRGCPIDRGQLLDVVSALLRGGRPRLTAHSVCLECKMRGTVCVMVAKGEPCRGPVTHAGRGALCPSFDRSRYGCFGPKENPNTASLAERLTIHGLSGRDLTRVFRTFKARADDFRKEAEAHDP